MPVLKWTEHSLTVTREDGDPKRFTNSGWDHRGSAAGESKFLYWLKGILNAQGQDLIKKRMWKDGHLVDDLQQYLRVRSVASVRKGAPNIALWSPHFALEGLDAVWNRGESVTLLVETPMLKMPHARLEYLRKQLRKECISYGELAELQSLAGSIDPSDVELLEAAGVPEFATA